jgi:hypothetical protein
VRALFDFNSIRFDSKRCPDKRQGAQFLPGGGMQNQNENFKSAFSGN